MISLTTILALAVSVHAAPIEGDSVGSFSIPAVHNVHHIRNGTAALLKAYKKFNLQPSELFSESFLSEIGVVVKRQDGSVSASPDPYNVEYLCPVTIGGQTLNLDFDTGSADLWVFSSLLASSSKTGHNIYTSSKSSTYKAKSGYTWDISYADGSGASGVVGTDTVTVGQTTVQGQVIELANKVSSSFVTDASDGLLGLSFSSINTVRPVQAKTFFDNAKSNLNSPLFAAYLPKETDGKYDFGAIDSTKFTGSLVYADVDSSGGWWEFSSTKYKVGTTSGTMSGFTGIADTGTTLILMGDAAVRAYYGKVSGATNSRTDGGYVFPCSSTLPDLSFLIGGSTYATVPGALINFAPASASGQCFGGLQSVGGGSMNVYGDVFLNAYYSVFDSDGPRFGFARSTGPI